MQEVDMNIPFYLMYHFNFNIM